MNVVISNCDVYIGESNNIVVDLPDGIKPTSDASCYYNRNRPARTNRKQGITVISIGTCGLHRKRCNRYVRKNYTSDCKGRFYR